MVTHKQRNNLAVDFCSRMAAAYPLLIGGVYGSTARGTDTAWSDLEMWFVVEDECEAQGKHFIYRGISAGYRVMRERELINILTQPDERWPFHMGVLSVLEVLHGEQDTLQAWIRKGAATPRKRFLSHLRDHLPDLVVESYGRVHSSALRRDLSTCRYSVTEVLFEMQTALCLLNQRWVTRGYDAGLMQVAAFPKIPKGYADLVTALLGAQTFEEILPLTDRLVDNFWALVAAEGIEVKNYQTVEEIPL